MSQTVFVATLEYDPGYVCDNCQKELTDTGLKCTKCYELMCGNACRDEHKEYHIYD